jgi:hypothetical protein
MTLSGSLTEYLRFADSLAELLQDYWVIPQDYWIHDLEYEIAQPPKRKSLHSRTQHWNDL